MSTLVKKESGIILDEPFKENSLIWTLNPSKVDCLRFEQDGLHILHNSKYVTYLVKELDKSYCLIAEIDHKPVSEEDIGGIIVFSNTNNYAECQTYLASAPSTIGNDGSNINNVGDLGSVYTRYSFDDDEELDISTEQSGEGETIENEESGFVDTIYKFIKLIKHKTNTNNIYNFYASADGIDWINVGNVSYDQSNYIGFFLYSTRDQNVLNNGKFVVNACRVYKKNYITIFGIGFDKEFEIFDRSLNRTIVRSDDDSFGRKCVNHYKNRVEINTISMYLPLRDAFIRIYPKNEWANTIDQYDLPGLVYGGDIFDIYYDIQLRINNEIIEPDNIYDLGSLFPDSFRNNIVVFNNEDFDLTEVTLKIESYSEFYTGEENIQIALFENDIEDYEDEENVNYELEYNNTLTIDRIPPHSGAQIVIKLTGVPKQKFYSVANRYRFKILIE